MQKKLTIQTSKPKEIIDITETLHSHVIHGTELLHVHVLHTTCALTIADLDPGTDLDMLDAFYTMVPKLNYRHPHNPDHVPDHILSSLIGVSVTLPVSEEKLVLGTWQRVILCEFDGPQPRTVIITQRTN